MLIKLSAPAIVHFCLTDVKLQPCRNITAQIMFCTNYDKYNPLRAGRSGDRIPVGAIFSAPVQKVPEAHPASYTMVPCISPGEGGRGLALTTYPHPTHNAKVKERVKLYLYSTNRSFLAGYRANFILPFITFNKIFYYSNTVGC